MRTALLQVSKSFCEPAIDERFRSEGDFPILNRGLQQVSDFNPHLLANVLGNDDLELLLDGDYFHRRSV